MFPVSVFHLSAGSSCHTVGILTQDNVSVNACDSCTSFFSMDTDYGSTVLCQNISRICHVWIKKKSKHLTFYGNNIYWKTKRIFFTCDILIVVFLFSTTFDVLYCLSNTLYWYILHLYICRLFSTHHVKQGENERHMSKTLDSIGPANPVTDVN